MSKTDDFKKKLDEKKKAEEMRRKLEEQAKAVSATEALNGTAASVLETANQPVEIEYQRYILNLDAKLIDAIEDYVHQEKRNGKALMDIKTGLPKKINRSLWARHVFVEALKKAGIEID